MIPKRKVQWILAMLAPMALYAGPAALAQDPEPAGDSASPPAAAPPVPKVLAVESDLRTHPEMAGLGDRITLKVENLDVLLADAGGSCKDIVLFIGGLSLADLVPERCDTEVGEVGYLLQRTSAADDSWRALLGRPTGFKRTVTVTIGSSVHHSIPTAAGDFRLVVLPKRGFYIFVFLFAAILALFCYLAARTDLIRDTGVLPLANLQRPYSLSRFQMAFWSLLVLGAYLFIWMVTGELDTITDSVLALIGIGSGTALGASLVDSSKRQARAVEKGRLEGEKKALQKVTAEVETTPGEAERLTAKESRLGEVEARLATSTEPVKSATTGSFVGDVLGDSQGISIHRFQMFVWTIVLGVIFCASVYEDLKMPQFSATLLGLMGISSGTYLGFKFPEQHAAPKD